MKPLLCICCYFAFEVLSAQAYTFITHSHNDYKHKRPLYDALYNHFGSIEADIYAVGDSLFVAHNFHEIKSGYTLQNLYLKPLKEQIEKNNRSVYGDGKEIILFIDIKDDATQTYTLLHKTLEKYKSYLSEFKNGKKTKRQVVIIISGNRPFQMMKNQAVRYAGYDGRLDNLDSNISANLMPVISDNWNDYFSWNGKGKMLRSEKKKLNKIVHKAKDKGYLLRFWATPNQTKKQRIAVWTELKNAGVNLIGTDYLVEMKEFIQNTK